MTLYYDNIPPPNHVQDAKIQAYLNTAAPAFFAKNSGGNLNVQFDYDPQEIPIPSSVGAASCSECAAQYISGKFVDLTKYDYYFFYLYKNANDSSNFDVTSCNGTSTIGKKNVITSYNIAIAHINAACINSAPQLAMHELGHSFGLGHANLLVEGTQYTDPKQHLALVNSNDACTVMGDISNSSNSISQWENQWKVDGTIPAVVVYCLQEYGDDTLMGQSTLPSWDQYKLSTIERKILGAPIKSLSVTTSGTYGLSTDSSLYGGSDEIQIPLGTMGSYAVEYRNDVKPEIVIRYVPSNAIKVFLFTHNFFGDTYRVKDLWNASYTPGQSFTDKFKNITITYVASTPPPAPPSTTPSLKGRVFNNAPISISRVIVPSNTAQVKVDF